MCSSVAGVQAAPDGATEGMGQAGEGARALRKGDYVLATKYRDGDPYDGYAVGFYEGPLAKDIGRAGQPQHIVVDGDGNPYRANGFRRVERITEELGSWIVQNAVIIEARTRMNPINIWRFKYGGERARDALLASAGTFTQWIAKVQAEADSWRQFQAAWREANPPKDPRNV